jgi:hypothetical protein
LRRWLRARVIQRERSGPPDLALHVESSGILAIASLGSLRRTTVSPWRCRAPRVLQRGRSGPADLALHGESSGILAIASLGSLRRSRGRLGIAALASLQGFR